MNKIFCVVTLFFTLFSPIFAPCVEHIHALIAGDTFCNLKAEVNNNKVHMVQTLETIAAQTGMILDITVLTDNNLTEKAIFAWLDQVRQTPGGVALFSYSGHGYRTESCTEPLPLLYFTRNTHAFRTDTFYHQLESTGSRLTIMLLDCCNTLGRYSIPAYPKSPLAQDLPGMKKLFLGTQGKIVFMGAAPAGTSWYYHGQGGLFTSSFIRSLLEETQISEASWQRLFERTYRYCSSIQRPFSLLNISHSDTPQ